MDEIETFNATVPEDCSGERVDHALAKLFPDYSRSRLQTWLKDGQILINGETKRAKDKVLGGEQVELTVIMVSENSWEPENIPLNIVYEDEQLLVINKPAGMVVHPAAGNFNGTMLNALLHYAPELEAIPRAGIVHRLDKETSGLLVVARTLTSQKLLVEQLQARTFLREYDAIIRGSVTAGSTINEPIGRHPINRKRMAVNSNGKPAITHYRISERYRLHTKLTVKLETGRTHQIRVHMAHINHPLLGDPVYGGRFKIPAASDDAFVQMLKSFKRQALHARHLGLIHPATNEFIEWEVDVPQDMLDLQNALRLDFEQHKKAKSGKK
ncbi:MAG TPA: 23S rRNA pseudouridine(1911/1915/1917) synthase RluD [Gammaproteobacteria bacterium]|nr:23S rRNA pseudouridine(1911/1915/1917) synthase RluD [Gammaproteobacteria bacterium]